MYVHAETLQWYDPALLFPGAPLCPSAPQHDRSGPPSLEAVQQQQQQQQQQAPHRACQDLLDRLAHRTLSSDPAASGSTAEWLDALHAGEQRDGGGGARSYSPLRANTAADGPLRGALDDVDGDGNVHLHGGDSDSDANSEGAADLDASLAWFTRGRHGAAAGDAGRGESGGGSAAQRTRAVRDAFQTLPPRLGAQEESVLCPLNTRAEPLAHVVAAAEVFAVVTARVPQTLYIFDQLNAIPISSCVLGGTTYTPTGCVTAVEADAGASTTPTRKWNPGPSCSSSSCEMVIDTYLVAVDDTVTQAWMDPTGHYCVLVFASGACVYYCIPRHRDAARAGGRVGDNTSGQGADARLPSVDESSEEAADGPRRRQQRHREWRAAARRWLRWSRHHPQDGGGEASTSNVDAADTEHAANAAAAAAAAARPRGFSLTLRMPALSHSAPRGAHDAGHAPAQRALVTPSCVGWCRRLSTDSSECQQTAADGTAPPHPDATCPGAEVLLGAASGGALMAARLTPAGAEAARVVFTFPGPLAAVPIDSVVALCTPPPPPVPAVHSAADASSPVTALHAGNDAAAREGRAGERDAAAAGLPTYAHTPHFLCADEEDALSWQPAPPPRPTPRNAGDARAPASTLAPPPPPPHPTDRDGALRWRWVVLVSRRNRLYVFHTPPPLSPSHDPAPVNTSGMGSAMSLLPPRLTGTVDDAFAAYRRPPRGAPAAVSGRPEAADHVPRPGMHHADVLTNYLTVEPAAVGDVGGSKAARVSPHRWPPSRVREAEEPPPPAPGGGLDKDTPLPDDGTAAAAAAALPTASTFLATNPTRGTVHLALPTPSSRPRGHDGGGVVTPAALPAVFYWQYGPVLVQGVVLCGGGGLEVGARVHQLVRHSVRRATEPPRGGTALESGLRDMLDDAVRATQDLNAWSGAEGRPPRAAQSTTHPSETGANAAARPLSSLAPSASTPPPSIPASVVLPIGVLSVVNLNTCLPSLQRLLRLHPTRPLRSVDASSPRARTSDGGGNEEDPRRQPLTYRRCAVRATDGVVVDKHSVHGVGGGGGSSSSADDDAEADAAVLHAALQFPWTPRLALPGAAATTTATGARSSRSSFHGGGRRVVAVPLLEAALVRGDVDAQMRRRLCAFATAYTKRSPLLFETPVESTLRIAAATAAAAAAPPLHDRLPHAEGTAARSSSTRSSARRHHARETTSGRAPSEPDVHASQQATTAPLPAAPACVALAVEAEELEDDETLVSVSVSYSHLLCTTTAGVYVFAHAAVLPVEEAAQSWRRALVYHTAWPPRRRRQPPPPAPTALAAAAATAAPLRAAPLFIALADPASPDMFYVASSARITRLQTPSPFVSTAGRRGFVMQLLAAAAAAAAFTQRGGAARLPVMYATSGSASASATRGRSRAWLVGNVSATNIGTGAAVPTSHATAAAALVTVTVPSSLAYEVRLRGGLCEDAEEPSRDEDVDAQEEKASSTTSSRGSAGGAAAHPRAAAAAATTTTADVSASATVVPELRGARFVDTAKSPVPHHDQHQPPQQPQPQQQQQYPYAARSAVSALVAPSAALSFHPAEARVQTRLQLSAQSTTTDGGDASDNGGGAEGVDEAEVHAHADPVDSRSSVASRSHNTSHHHHHHRGSLRRAPRHRSWSVASPASPHSFTALATAAAAQDSAFTHRSSDGAAAASVSDPHADVRRPTRHGGAAAAEAGAAAVAAVVPASRAEDRDLLAFLRANPLLHLMAQRAARLGEASGGPSSTQPPGAAAAAGAAAATAAAPPPSPSTAHGRAVNISGFGVLPGTVGLVPLSPTAPPAVACLLLQSPVGAHYFGADHLFEMALAVCAAGVATRATTVAALARSASRHHEEPGSEVHYMPREDVELWDVVRHAYGGYLLASQRFVEAAVQLGKASARGPTPVTTSLLELLRAFREYGAVEPLIVFLRLRLRSLERSTGGLGGHGLQVSLLATWLLALALEACSAARAQGPSSEARPDRRTPLRADAAVAAADDAAADLTRVAWVRQRHGLDAPQALLEDTLLRYGRFVDWAVASDPLLHRLASAPEAVLAAELLGRPGDSVVNLVFRQERHYAGAVRLEALLADPTTRAPETRALLRALVRGAAPATEKAEAVAMTGMPAGTRLMSITNADATSVAAARPLASSMPPRALASLIGRVSPVLLRCYPCRLVQNVLRAPLEQHAAAAATLSPHRLLPALLTYTTRHNESDFELNGDVAVVLRALELARADATAARDDAPIAQHTGEARGGGRRRHRGLSTPVPADARSRSDTTTATHDEAEPGAQAGGASTESATASASSFSASGAASSVDPASVSEGRRLARSVQETRAPASRPPQPCVPPTWGSSPGVVPPAAVVGATPHPNLPTTAAAPGSVLSPTMSLQWGSADALDVGSEHGSVDEDIQLPTPIAVTVAALPTTSPPPPAPPASTAKHERRGLVSAVGAAAPPAAAARRLARTRLHEDEHMPRLEQFTSSTTTTTTTSASSTASTRSTSSTSTSSSDPTASSFDSQLDALLEVDATTSSVGSAPGAAARSLMVPQLSPDVVAAAIAAPADVGTSAGSARHVREPAEADLRAAAALLSPATQNAALAYLGALAESAVARWAGGRGGGGTAAADAAALLVAYAGVLARDGAEADLQEFAERIALQHLRARDTSEVVSSGGAPAGAAVPPYHLLHVWRLCAARRRWVGCVWVYFALGYHRDAVQLALEGVGGAAGLQLAVRLLRLLRDRDVQRERATRVREVFGYAGHTESPVGGGGRARGAIGVSTDASDAQTDAQGDRAAYVGDVAYTQQQAVRWSRRALWMLVARHLIHGSGATGGGGDRVGAQTALQLSLRSGGDHLNVTDVLPELPDDLFIAELQEQLLAAVQELARTMRGLRANTAALGRDTRVLHRELSAVALTPLPLQVDERCVVCGQPALARPFIMYPRCRHLIHAACYHQARPPQPRPTSTPARRENSTDTRGTAKGRATRTAAEEVMECLLCARGRLHRLLDTPLSIPLIGDEVRQPRPGVTLR